ncbi:TetR/AcrR family transcriptional regulator [Pontibacter sp. G13]|uniref:TetR/AcrR family transcriptional regulator n=1 Tax=Pontibacter sp. G13 TaxID=3074898 RepID=UPI00288A2836|nr:TetR/AcrR family transcriptional regulator [Pontibacter sp. G13]WNJ18575.1 TetR/AcrR family transcriptional regulator [Pontibacter sp. G13]
MKARILEAARELAIQDGWPNVSIRKIGYKIEYTPPVIYEHFRNKEAILIELEHQGFRMLGAHLDDARQTQTDPMAQLKAITAAFWDWAFRHAELYQVMFNMEGIRSTATNPMALRESAHSVLKTLSHLMLFAGDLDEMFLSWWSLAHGHVSLVMSGQLRGRDDQMRKNLLASVGRFAKTLA